MQIGYQKLIMFGHIDFSNLSFFPAPLMCSIEVFNILKYIALLKQM